MNNLDMAVDLYKRKRKLTFETIDNPKAADRYGGRSYNGDKLAVFHWRMSDINKMHTLCGKMPRIGEEENKTYGSGRDFTGLDASEWNDEIANPNIVAKILAEAREKLSKEGIEHSLREILRECSPIRKRRASEYDGDFDLARRWEMKPFMSTIKENSDAASIKIFCKQSFNCGVDQKDITEYASITGAISDIIESLGVKTQIINLYQTVDRWAGDGKCKADLGTNLTEERVLVKDFNDYGDLHSMSTSFHTSTFRRSIFVKSALTAHVEGWEQDYALGHSLEHSFKVDQPGEITLTLDSIRALKKGDKKEIDRLTQAILPVSGWNNRG